MQSLDAGPLLALTVAAPAGLGASARKRWLHLLRRSRWLVIVLALTFFLSTPGEALIPGLPGTSEGALAALEQGARFVLILAAVAWLLDRCPRERLIAGFYCLSAPIRRLGYPSERAIVRLVLVFDEVERGGAGREWRRLLETPAAAPTQTLKLELPVLRRRDIALAGLGLVLLVAALLGVR